MKNPEDRWGKYLFQRLFQEHAEIATHVEVPPDAMYVDICLVPRGPLPEDLPGAGLLARLTEDRHCLVEPYSSSPTAMDLRTSFAKLHLVLREAHRKQTEPQALRGCLWILTRYWPQQAIEHVFEAAGQELEKGLWFWPSIDRLYVVHTSEISLREETLLFRLLARGRQRQEAVRKIIQEKIEPYFSLLADFEMELGLMSQVEESRELSDEEQMQDLKEMFAARQEALIEVARREERQEIARKMLVGSYDLKTVEELTGLAIEELEALLEAMLQEPGESDGA